MVTSSTRQGNSANKAGLEPANHLVSATIRPLAGHTVDELKQLLEEKGASVREIVPGVLNFDGQESTLKHVESVADVSINVDQRLHPEFL